MTTSEFSDLLKNPSGIHTMSYESLDNLLLQYPYCNGIRMLLLKKYKNDRHSAFERHLALASMYASDRGKLYEFLNASMVSNAAVIETKPTVEKKTKITTQLVAPPPVFYYKVSDNPPALAFQKPLTVEDLTVGYHSSDEEANSNRSLSAMPIEEWLQDFEPARMGEKNAALKKNFKLSRIPMFEKDMFAFLEDENMELEEKPQPKSKKAKSSKTTLQNPDKLNVQSKEKKTVLEDEEELLKQNLKKIQEEFEAIEDEDIDSFIIEKSSINEPVLEEKTAKKKKTKQPEEKETKEGAKPDVFEFFVTQASSFLKSINEKKDGLSKKDLDDWDDDSTDEKEEVVSETLADILAKQGQKDKAIKMYEALSLKFPKKSRLFADKIAKLG